MTSYAWGTATGNWSGASSDWTPAGPPNAPSDQAEISNAGTYTVTVVAGTSFQLDTLDINDGDATVVVAGTLDFDGTASLLTLEAGTLTVQGGVIEGGTLEASGGTLDAVTLHGELVISDSGYVQTTGALVVDTATGAPGGTLVLGYGAELDLSGSLTVGTTAASGSIDLENDGAALVFEKNETLNDALITVSGNDEAIESNARTLTFGSAATVNLSGSSELLTGSFVNAGTFEVTGGDTTIDDYSDSTFSNKASLSVGAAALTIATANFSNTGSIVVGAGGLLDVEVGVTFTNAAANLGSVVVASGGTLDLQNAVSLAQLQSGLTVETGGTLAITGVLSLGTGTLDPSLFGTVLLTNGGTISGGTIDYEAGAITFEDGTLIGVAVVTAGTVDISDGSLFVADGNFSNTGAIVIESGGLLSIDGTTTLRSESSVTVEAGGTLELNYPITLATLEASSFVVEAGGTLAIGGSLDLQSGTLGIGGTALLSNVELSGGTIANGTIRVGGGTFTIAEPGGTFSGVTFDGGLAITAATSLTVLGGLTVNGAAGSAPGSLTLGAYSGLSITGGLSVGSAAHPGSIELTSNDAFVVFNDTETLDAAAVTVSGSDVTLEAAGASLTFGSAATMNWSGAYETLQGSFINDGSIGVTGGSTTALGGSFDNEGSLSIAGGYLLISSTSFTSSSAVVIGAGGTLEIVPASAASVTYDDPATLIIDDPTGYTGTLSGFTPGDVLVLDGENVAHAGIVGTTLTVVLSGGGTPLTYHTGPGLNGTTFTISQDNDGYDDVLTVACFLPGTLIATPSGETKVEQLAVGDRVRTAGGGVRPITWIGHGRALATSGRRSAATPVVVGKGALADNVPHRDLRVTKGHALFLDDVLVPVEFLVNHRSIRWDDTAREVTYYHLELDAHDVLLANGAPAESYRDDGNRWLFRNANSGWDLPPKLPCARVVTGGAAVDAIWRRLLERAGPRPRLPLTTDADLHLLADGVRVEAVARLGSALIFALQHAPSDLRIVSRAGSPQELGLARDPRCLGVALRRIEVRRGHRVRVIGADDERLAEGFHAFEADNGFRWTDGEAVLPKALLGRSTGPLELWLHCAGTACYVQEGEPLAGAFVAAQR